MTNPLNCGRINTIIFKGVFVMKQSGFGIASLVLSIVGFLTSCVVVGIIPSFLALIFAIIGLCQKDRGKGTAIAGLVLSLISVVSFLFLVVIGFSLSEEGESYTQDSNKAISDNNNNKDTSISVWADEPTDLKYFTYKKNPNDNTITISSYDGYDSKVWISPTYNINDVEYTVTKFEGSVFFCNDNITSVILPEGLTYMENNTFNSCSNIKYLYLPSTLEPLESGYTLFDYIDDVLEEVYYGGTNEQWRYLTREVEDNVLDYLLVYTDCVIEKNESDKTVVKGTKYSDAE